MPLTIRFGDEELVDREELSVAEFWQPAHDVDACCPRRRRRRPARSRRGSASSPTTARPASSASTCRRASRRRCRPRPGRRQGRRRRLPDRGDRLAARCRWASGASASPPRAAPPTAADLESIVADVIDRRDRTRLFGALDTLEFLKRGGRIGNARALLGSMLSIKPVVEVRDGVVEEAGKVRTRSKALARPRRPRAGPAGREPAPCSTARRPTSTSCSTSSTRSCRRRRDRHRDRRPGDRDARGPAGHRRELPGESLTLGARRTRGRRWRAYR